MRRGAAAALALLLAGCALPAGDMTGTPEHQVTQVCGAWRSVYGSLLARRKAGLLSAQQIATVNLFRPILNDGCAPGAPLYEGKAGELQNALGQLEQVLAQAQAQARGVPL